jgi:hypothetical protein
MVCLHDIQDPCRIAAFSKGARERARESADARPRRTLPFPRFHGDGAAKKKGLRTAGAARHTVS